MDVTNQIRNQFKPEMTLIKNRIADLIDREYLERFEAAGTGRASYRYLA